MNSEKDLEIARWSDLVKALQVEVTEARKEAQYYKEKWPTALDLTIRERLTAQVEAAIEKRDREREDHMTAAMLVAKMHAAAVGEVTGPRRSVVEDVEDLRSERDDLQRRLDATRMYVNAHPGSYLSRSQQDVWLHELRVVLFASASDNQQESNGEVVPYGAGAGCKPAVSDPGGSIPPLSTNSPVHHDVSTGALPEVARKTREGVMTPTTKIAEALKACIAAFEPHKLRAESYEIACEELERYQYKRIKSGRHPGTQGSLIDGSGSLFDMLDEAEDRAAQAEAQRDEAVKIIEKMLETIQHTGDCPWYDMNNVPCDCLVRVVSDFVRKISTK